MVELVILVRQRKYSYVEDIMASSKEYINFVLDKLYLLDNISYRSMMGSIFFIIMEYYLVEYMMTDFLLKLLIVTKNLI
jgi:hypothetical protein